MNPDLRHALLDLYAEWRRLTELEGAAIDREEWPVVFQQQQLKRGLQDEIVRVTEAWNHELSAAREGSAPFDRDIRPIIADLIRLESHNHELVCERRQTAHSLRQTLDQSSANLRAIHRAYAPGAAVRWQSYS
jgi:hypothetical protein